MNRFALAASIASMALAFAASAANDPKQREDLAAVLALQGKPCSEVVSYTVHGDNDFTAVCKDGNKYRLYVKDGRVVIDKK